MYIDIEAAWMDIRLCCAHTIHVLVYTTFPYMFQCTQTNIQPSGPNMKVFVKVQFTKIFLAIHEERFLCVVTVLVKMQNHTKKIVCDFIERFDSFIKQWCAFWRLISFRIVCIKRNLMNSLPFNFRPRHAMIIIIMKLLY